MHVLPVTTVAERRTAFALRARVFVDEQGVPSDEEIDERDETDAEHVLAFRGEEAVGTGRLVPNGRTAKIGRFAVVPSARGRGVGALLVRHCIDMARGRFDTLILDAQLPVIGFYERFGFVAEGPVFDDAGIAHRRMRISLLRSPARPHRQ